MIFQPRPTTSSWVAKGHHLCIADVYDVTYDFNFQGVAIKEWEMVFAVRGPAKDYTLKSLFRR